MANILFMNAEEPATQRLIEQVAQLRPTDQLRLITTAPHRIKASLRQRFEVLVGSADDGLFYAQATAGIDAIYMSEPTTALSHLKVLAWVLLHFDRRIKQVVFVGASRDGLNTVSAISPERFAILNALRASQIGFVFVQQLNARLANHSLIETIDAHSQILRRVVNVDAWAQVISQLLIPVPHAAVNIAN